MTTLEFDYENGEINIKSQLNQYDDNPELSELEKEAILIIKKIFEKEHLSFETVSVRRYSKEYLTLVVPPNNDFCRFKAGKKSTWISLDISICKKELENDIRFSDVQNRRKKYWKINLNSVGDFENVIDLIVTIYRKLISKQK